MCSSLGGGATAKEEGRVDGTPRDSVVGEAMCSSRGVGATAEAEGRADSAPRGSVARCIVKIMWWAFLPLV